MTIQFKCPKCQSLIAFADKHAGKPARCLNCGQQLIIPAKTGQKGSAGCRVRETTFESTTQ